LDNHSPHGRHPLPPAFSCGRPSLPPSPLRPYLPDTESGTITVTNFGTPHTISSNRQYLLRALRLGFREVHLYGTEAPVLCDDGRRQFVWAVLGPNGTIPTGPDVIRIASTPRPANRSNGRPKQRRSKPAMSEPTTPPTNTPAAEQVSATRRRGKPPAKGTPTENAIALRNALRAAVVQANELIRSLKRHKREARLVESTLASLRTLQKVAS
jgi:hypothetical protein